MRIYAISDMHGYFPTIPECELLLVGGDICPDKVGGKWCKAHPEVQATWFKEVWMAWRRTIPAKNVLVTWGNHDFCGSLVRDEDIDRDDTRIVVDRLVLAGVDLGIWMSPWCPVFRDWAFMKTEDQLADVYAKIPEGIDILVSHCPPYGYGDLDLRPPDRLGSSALRYALDRIKPKVVVCGHIHDGYGEFRLEHPDGKVTAIYNVVAVREHWRELGGRLNPPTEIHLD